MRQQYHKQFHCLNMMLRHCLLRKSTVDLSQAVYCGALFMTQRSHSAVNQQYQSAIVLELIGSHNIHVHFIRFTFWSSRQYRCEQHGMNVTYAEKTLGTYCGRRVPWTLLIPTHKAYLNLTTIGQKSYTLFIFYSCFHNDWISDIIQVDTLSCVAPTSINLGAENFSIKMNTFQLYIITKKTNSIEIFVSSASSIVGDLLIHDGPGPLSEVLFEKNKSGTSLYKKLRTTAFYAFININMYPINNDSYLFLIQSARNKNMECVTSDTGVLRKNSKKRRNVVCINNYAFANMSIGLFILTFRFYGPNQLINTLGIECQYGGLMVEFDNNGKHIEFCSSINKIVLNSGFSITFSLVWFSGYSKGILISSIQEGRCPHFYVELYPPEILYKPEVVFRHDELLACYHIVCPPLVRAVQRTCNLQLGPVGTVEIRVRRKNTIDKCDVSSINTFPNKQFDYDLNVSSSDNWPFGPINNTYTRYTSTRSKSVHYFRYLHNGTLRLNLFCKKSNPWQQVSVYVMESTCKVDKTFKILLSSQNIPSLSKSCMGYTYVFTPREKDNYQELNYHEFIYKDNGDVHTGHEIYMNYKQCPTECRNYKFAVYVKSADNHTIFEYVSKLGFSISTGYYHRGYRVDILMPEERECAGCHLVLIIDKQTFFINGAHKYVATIGRRKYRLYKNR